MAGGMTQPVERGGEPAWQPGVTGRFGSLCRPSQPACVVVPAGELACVCVCASAGWCSRAPGVLARAVVAEDRLESERRVRKLAPALGLTERTWPSVVDPPAGAASSHPSPPRFPVTSLYPASADL